MNIISMIIDRDCHVSWSNRRVIKHVISRLRNGYRTFATMQRAERRRFMQECIRIHHANQKEYRFVMGQH